MSKKWILGSASQGGDNVETSHKMTTDFQTFIGNHVKIRLGHVETSHEMK
jgi:hypothetical protein